MTQIIEHLSEISDRYDALFVDLWGCVHNGITAFPEAVKALQDYRAKDITRFEHEQIECVETTVTNGDGIFECG